MFETSITIVGNVLSQPETRRTMRTGAMVTSFRVASTSRRFDRVKENWVDGESLRVKVSCWRRLGDHVAASVRQGDPVIVTGRVYTREYLTDGGEKRIAFELDAAAVGHDLAKGTGRFNRWRASPNDMLGDGSDAQFAGGEFTGPVSEDDGGDSAVHSTFGGRLDGALGETTDETTDETTYERSLVMEPVLASRIE
ncbi:MAG: single-stranded DNA-binding protein [Longispora sp.]|nr:single-stranded DNA-binding protein [Longispora sp. (in: high G+C Gram-positive bacteria)]